MHAIAADWRRAELGPADRALCAFAETVSREPWHLTPRHLDPLREAGFDDDGILDATQVIAYFNYINRIADALGVEDEADFRAWGNPADT